jgi:hypothetical protein
MMTLGILWWVISPAVRASHYCTDLVAQADMYLRGRDAIEEGDDLEFENHLVTVEDFKGTVVQDLTPLFTSTVKRKQVGISNVLNILLLLTKTANPSSKYPHKLGNTQPGESPWTLGA